MTSDEVLALALRIREVIPPYDPLGAWRHYYHAQRRLDCYVAGWHRCQKTLDNSGAASYLAEELQKTFEDLLRRLAREYGVRQ